MEAEHRVEEALAAPRSSPALKAAALDTARRVAASPGAPPRWVGKDAVKALEKAAAKT